jgi:NAD(P)-dependent dehydrogenase (short-subunit alcohol dehydrogenase family)
MDLQLKGNVAVVVGGAAGIGRAIASAFLAEGAHVVIFDLAPETPSVASDLASGDPSRAFGIVADVTHFAEVVDVAGQVVRDYGRSDHLVYAAGIGSGQFGFPFWKVDPSVWDRVLRVNLVGAAHVAQAFAPGMAEAKSGTMLFIASVAGQIGSQTDPPYSASKAGLINFAQCAAKDLAPHGVRVNTLCPGMVQTTLNRSVYEAWAAHQPEEGRPTYDQWAGEKVKTIVPLGRWQTPEDIAAMAVFLASSRAKNVTGQTINVDGGYVMHW